MTGAVRRYLVWLLLLVPVLLVAALYWRFSPQPALVAEDLNERGFWLHPQAPRVSVPDLPDHRGGVFTGADFEGRWTWVFFGYSHCPDICGPTVVLMHRARELLLGRNWRPEELQLLMVSVDPGADTAETMTAFLGRRAPDTLGLLPDPQRLRAVASVFHADYGEAVDGLVDHTGNIMVLDPDGRYRGFFRAPTTVDRVAGVLEVLRDARNAALSN